MTTILATLMDLPHVFGWIEWYGYPMLFLLLFACGLGLPLPEDIPLLIAGALVGSGHMQLGIAAAVAWCGIIGGDCVLYLMGRRFGMNITRVRFVGRHLTAARIGKAEELFARYGVWVVAIGRMFAGVRGAMVVAAGTIRFHFITFIIADGLAAIVSGGLFVFLGWWFGSNVAEIRARIAGAEHWALAGLLVLGAGVLGYRWWRRRHRALSQLALDKAAEHIDQHPRAPLTGQHQRP